VIDRPFWAYAGGDSHRCSTPMPHDSDPEALLDTAAAAKRLKVSTSFLTKGRMRGDGPRYRKFRKVVRYSPADLDEYELNSTRISTTEQPAVAGLVPKASAEPERQRECLAATRLRRGSRSARGPP
jgi:hypothetical protein